MIKFVPIPCHSQRPHPINELGHVGHRVFRVVSTYILPSDGDQGTQIQLYPSPLEKIQESKVQDIDAQYIPVKMVSIEPSVLVAR